MTTQSYGVQSLSAMILAVSLLTGCQMTTTKSDEHLATDNNTRGNITDAYLNQIVNEAREKFGVPAIAVMLMNADAIYRQEIQGVRVANQLDLATLDDFFHIGSTGKSLLAVMAAKLIEQGQISWQTRFFELFPDLLGDANPAYANITLEDLLLSQAGIQAFTDGKKETLPEFDASVKNKRFAFIQYLIKQPPSAKKKNGKFQRLYSNPSYMMASAMLEQVTGLSYEKMVKQTLEKGLQTPVHIGWPNSISAAQHWGHRMKGRKVEEIFPPDHDYQLPYLLTPAGDLSMTPKGYARYTQLHLKGLRGEDNYISSQSYQHIHFGHKDFSLGIANGRFRDHDFSGFDGSATTFFCRSIIVPDADFAFTIMINAASSRGTSGAAEWLTMKIIEKQFNLKWWEKILIRLVG